MEAPRKSSTVLSFSLLCYWSQHSPSSHAGCINSIYHCYNVCEAQKGQAAGREQQCWWQQYSDGWLALSPAESYSCTRASNSPVQCFPFFTKNPKKWQPVTESLKTSHSGLGDSESQTTGSWDPVLYKARDCVLLADKQLSWHAALATT